MIKDLIIIINDKKTENEIILMIDANEGISESNSGIRKLLIKTQMCHPIFLQHGSKNEPNTYARGSRRIDFVFCTSNISQYIIQSGILPFDSIATTDHRALYIDIKLKEDLRDSHQIIKTPKQEGYNHVLLKVS